MNPYSGNSEFPPKQLASLTTDDDQTEVDAADWESQIARLVGLAETFPTVDNTSQDEQAIADPSVSSVQTEQPLATNPFAKLALVATGTFTIVVVAGAFLSQMMSINNQKPKPRNIIASPTASPTANLSPEATLQQEVETLKTKLALAEQAQAVKVAQQNLRNVTTPSVRPTFTPTTQNNSNNDRNRLQTAKTSKPETRTVIVERVVSNPYRQQPVPVVPALPPQLAPPPPAQSNSTPTPAAPDPFQEWSRLAKLGSYGQVNISSAPIRTVAAPESVDNTEMSPPRPNPRSSQGNSAPVVISQASNHSPKTLKPGTIAKAVLATAVFGETQRNRGNSGDDNDPNLFVVQLREPLKSVDGAIALPAKTELLTQVSGISEQGLVQLKLVKVIWQNNGNLLETDIPENALLIRASQGRPLLAQQYPNRNSSIAGMDAGLFLLGGIAKAAELYNRVDSQVTVNGGSTVVSNSSAGRDIAAGVLEGGLNSVIPQIAQRNQQAIAQMMQQTNIWILPAGTEVEIFVNQSVQF
ncbi:MULTISPECIES: TrbI/VirB10 family protein [unclassified Anabaena]|uniref:TrbI/VirB10 family protein n=1 Tax=unclassified Anabaena TaxID=2619674 RepID=UPI00082E4930|nr:MULTISPECIES: TrbI/VirB10 family protein [unclassified Anabaena]